MPDGTKSSTTAKPPPWGTDARDGYREALAEGHDLVGVAAPHLEHLLRRERQVSEMEERAMASELRAQVAESKLSAIRTALATV